MRFVSLVIPPMPARAPLMKFAQAAPGFQPRDYHQKFNDLPADQRANPVPCGLSVSVFPP